MDPFFARNRLSAYLDGALDDAEAAEVAAAIEADPALRTEYEELERAVSLLRTHGPVQAPEGFHARLMARVDQEPSQQGPVAWLRRSFAQVPVEALALAAAALVVVVVIQGRPGEDPASALTKDDARSVEQETAAAQLAAEQPPSGAAAEPGEADLDRISQATRPEARYASPAEGPPPDVSKMKSAPPAPQQATQKGAPAEPYVPEWETQGLTAEGSAGEGEASEDNGLSRPRGYRVSLSHPKALYDLQSIAQAAGGRLTDGQGKQLVPRALTYEDNYVLAFIAVPASQSAAVETALRKQLRAVEVPPPGATPLYGANQAGFVVEVHYMP